MRTLIGLGLGFASLLAFACGTRDDATNPSVKGGDPVSPSAGDCAGIHDCAPALCGATPVAACVHGQWTCQATGPVHLACDAVTDAGAPAEDATAAAPEQQPPGRETETPAPAAGDDAGAAAGDDAGAAAAKDAGADSGMNVPCGTTTCNGASQYCSIGSPGAATFSDGGSSPAATTYDCVALPGQCGSKPSCACISQIIGCSCGGSGGTIPTECVVLP